MRNIRKQSVLCMMLAVMQLGFFATPALAASTGGVGGRPANPDPDNPRTQSIFIYTLAGGTVKDDQIYLSNGGDSAETIEIYAVDGVITNTGAFTCEQEVEERNDIGAWLKLASREVTLPARSNKVVDFTIAVPRGVDVGEHSGCIAIQKKGDPGQQTGSVIVKTRQAVRVAVIVPGNIHRSVTVNDFQATLSSRGQKYTFGLENNGNVSADVDVDLKLRDWFGNEVYSNGGQLAVMAGATLDVIYEGQSKPFFGGWYSAKVSIAYDKRAGTFGTKDTTQLVKAESNQVTLFIWPSPAAFASLGLVVVLVVGFFVWRSRLTRHAKARGQQSLKSNRSAQRMWKRYEVKSGDTVQSLATKYGVEVSKIALLNKLSPPYTLVAGQVIYVPSDK